MTTITAATRQLFERLRDETADVDADFAVAPSTIEEAASVLAVAADAGVPTAILGGGTHGGYGSSVNAGLVITTSKLNRIVDWRPDDMTVIVEPGAPIDVLEEELAARNQTAVFPETGPGATVGGVVATGLSGFRRLRYGPTRDRVLRVTIATGYGKVITGGGPVVKSSTGYGVPRLVTGSMGSLGLIGPVLLKLWSRPLGTATVEVGDIASSLASTYRPLAALETSEGSFLYLGGAAEQIAAQAAAAGGEPGAGLAWPAPIDAAVRLEFRVPARFVAEAVDMARGLGADRWIAEHGVGRVEAGVGSIDGDLFGDARSWAESVGGALLLVNDTETGIDPWGTAPASIKIQRRIKDLYDPSGICNPGIMPGGI